MNDSLHRIIESIDYLKDNGKIHKQQDIADILGIEKGNLSRTLKGNPRYLTTGFLKRFASAFSDYINEGWLLEGKGEMAKASKDMRPHYDAKASAGFMDGISEGRMSAEFRAMAVPLNPYDFSIDVGGDSMYPKIEPGDTLMCRVSIDRQNPPIGKICVINTKDGTVVKVIKSVSDFTMTLHSLNPKYHDYEIDLNTILGIAEVTGLVRSFD